MTVHTVPRFPRGIDFETCKVGRPVTSARAYTVADLAHHMLQVRRKGVLSAVYQVDAGEVATPTRGIAAGTQYRWDYRAGPTTQYVRVDVLTLGGVISTTAQPLLIASSTTEPVGQFLARVVDANAPGAVLDADVLQTWSCVLEVTPDGVETIEIDQAVTTDAVRILGVTVTEMPIYQITTPSTYGVSLNNFASGEGIIATEYDDLCLAVQNVRRYSKKILFQSCKELATDNVGVGNIEDLHTKSAANLLQFAYYTSVPLPETADPAVAVTCYVYASASAGTGTVRFACTGGNIDIGAIGALGNYAATGTINRGSGSCSLQGYISDPGTLTVYGATMVETPDAS